TGETREQLFSLFLLLSLQPPWRFLLHRSCSLSGYLLFLFIILSFLPVYSVLKLFRPGLKAVGVSVEQLEDDAGGMVFVGKGVGFVRVNVHGQRVGRTDPDYYICKDQGTLIARGDHEDDVVILDVGAQRIHRSHVDMPFGDDDSTLQFHLSFRTDQKTARSALQIA